MLAKDESIKVLIQIVDAMHGKLVALPRPQMFPTWKVSPQEIDTAIRHVAALTKGDADGQ